MKNLEQEHELICNTGTEITKLSYEIEALTNMIEGYETYTNNALFVTNLKNLRQRLYNIHKSLETNFNAYVDFHEPQNA